MFRPAFDFNDLCPTHNVKAFVNSILQKQQLTIAQIANECRIPVNELHQVMSDQISYVPHNIFNKILYFYCYASCFR